MESNSCFACVNKFVGLCVERCEYHGFYIKPGMIVVDKNLAREAFGIAHIEDDAIVSYKDADDDYFGIWVKVKGEYKKRERCIASHLNELKADLEEIIASCGQNEKNQIVGCKALAKI